MYNRYAPMGDAQPLDEPQEKAAEGSIFNLFGKMLGNEKNAGLSGILDKLGIGQLDKGDILLLLVLIYLFRESGDEEWLIILALVLLMGLG